jgi:hypothetical protein
LRYLINRDLENIVWWYWLVDGDADIPLLPIQNPHVCIWAVGCRRYMPETSENIHYCSTECCIHHEFSLWTCKSPPPVEYGFSRINIRM